MFHNGYKFVLKMCKDKQANESHFSCIVVINLFYFKNY